MITLKDSILENLNDDALRTCDSSNYKEIIDTAFEDFGIQNKDSKSKIEKFFVKSGFNKKLKFITLSDYIEDDTLEILKNLMPEEDEEELEELEADEIIDLLEENLNMTEINYEKITEIDGDFDPEIELSINASLYKSSIGKIMILSELPDSTAKKYHEMYEVYYVCFL